MDDLINQINELATAILKYAEEFDQAIDQADRTPAGVERLRNLLQLLCGAVRRTFELLSHERSPLASLVHRLDGTRIADTVVTLLRLRATLNKPAAFVIL
jgi:hypothetical protein